MTKYPFHDYSSFAQWRIPHHAYSDRMPFLSHYNQAVTRFASYRGWLESMKLLRIMYDTEWGKRLFRFSAIVDILEGLMGKEMSKHKTNLSFESFPFMLAECKTNFEQIMKAMPKELYHRSYRDEELKYWEHSISGLSSLSCMEDLSPFWGFINSELRLVKLAIDPTEKHYYSSTLEEKLITSTDTAYCFVDTYGKLVDSEALSQYRFRILEQGRQWQSCYRVIDFINKAIQRVYLPSMPFFYCMEAMELRMLFDDPWYSYGYWDKLGLLEIASGFEGMRRVLELEFSLLVKHIIKGDRSVCSVRIRVHANQDNYSGTREDLAERYRKILPTSHKDLATFFMYYCNEPIWWIADDHDSDAKPLIPFTEYCTEILKAVRRSSGYFVKLYMKLFKRFAVDVQITGSEGEVSLTQVLKHSL